MHQRRRLQQTHPCTLVVVETEYQDGVDRPPQVACELDPEDAIQSGLIFVPVEGIDDSDVPRLTSGNATLLEGRASIVDGSLVVPPGLKKEDTYGSVPEHRRQRHLQQQTWRTTGRKTVLVVRVSGSTDGLSTSAPAARLSNKFFGTADDAATMKSQYAACSHGQLTFVPATGDNIVDGVAEVELNIPVAGQSRTTVEAAVEEEAMKKLGDIRRYDHVVFCLPSGTLSGQSSSWIGYAYVNSWLTVCNNVWCTRMSTQVHEIGHNLGLAHSGVPQNRYGDRSGVMGFSYDNDDWPRMCFNPAKSYQLGWYEGAYATWHPSDGTWIGTMVGVADYDADDSSRTVVLRIPQDGEDLYIGYNRKKGPNRQVVTYGDQLTIVSQGDGYSDSTFVGSVAIKGRTTIMNGQVTVDFISTNGIQARVAVYRTACPYPTCCEGSMCSQNVVASDQVPVSVNKQSILDP